MTATPVRDPVVDPRLLMVDDDADHRQLMSLVLRQGIPGITVTTAATMEEALRHLPENFDLAIVDLNLPDGSGIDVLKGLRTAHDLPVIIVTGERFGEPAVEGINAGAADYLIKHGDYLHVLPALVLKTLALQGIKNENARLQEELLRRNAELERLNVALRRMAAHDPLTGLYNRRHFNELFAQLFAESDRYGTDLTCVMIDLDGFKEVNDRHGHQAGDRLLVLAAESLQTALRASDVIARYGGDEFVLLMPRTTHTEAQQSARRMRTIFRDNLLNRMPHCASVSMSIGMASREQHQPGTHDALLRLADEALYQAKAAGKDRIVVVRPITVDS